VIAILRDPIERAYASYLGAVQQGWEPCAGFLEAVRDEPRRLGLGWSYAERLRTGLYHQHLSRFLELFPREHLLVHLYEDLIGDPASLLRSLFAFLGVDPGFQPDLGRRHNPSGQVANPALRALWTGSGRLRERLRPLLPRRLRDGAYALVMRRVVKPPLPPAARAALLGHFLEDTLRLEALLGRDLSAWRR
jgi:hypothetical protein